MKRSARWHRTAVVAALLGVITPHPLPAAGPWRGEASATETAAAMHDIALDARGNLHGQVLTESGAAAAELDVHVAQNGREIKRVRTDEQGRFQVSGLRGGVYQITTSQNGANYRVWAPRTAPPAAQQMALIVEDSEVVRAQGGRILNFITNPWVLGLGVAAAIAIPLALDDDEDAS